MLMNITKKICVTTIILVASLFSLALSAKPALNIAIVDVTQLQQQFLTEVNGILQSEFQDKQSKLQRELDQFKSEQDKFQKDSSTMTKEQVAKASQNLVEKQNSLQVKVQEFDQDLASRREQELQNKLQTLFGVVKNISDKEKYDMVIAKNAVLFVSEKFDITKEVVAGYNNAQEKSKKSKE